MPPASANPPHHSATAGAGGAEFRSSSGHRPRAIQARSRMAAYGRSARRR